MKIFEYKINKPVMKNFLRILSTLVLFPALLSAQPAWEWVNPAPQGKTILDAVYLGGNVLACGEGGLFMISRDKGITWETRDLSNTLNFNALAFTDTLNGILVGDNGIIYKTTDGGLTFGEIVSGVSDDLYSVSHINGSHFSAIGSNGTVLKSSDGGSSWSRTVIQGAPTVNSLAIINQDIWVAGGENGKIFRTVNSGADWVEVYSIAGKQISDLQLKDGFLYAAGYLGTMLRSSDNGVTWSLIQPPGTNWLKDIRPASGSLLYASGLNGFVAVSENGGDTWTASAALTTNTIQRSVLLENNEILFLGDKGLVLSSTDSAKSFSIRSSAITENLNSVRFISLDTGWIVGDRGLIMKTIDGGETWVKQNSGTTKAINEIFSYNGIQVWAVGNSGTFILSNDGGENWVPGQLSTIAWENLYTIYIERFFSRIGGQGGAFYEAFNNWGQTWVRKSIGITEDFRAFGYGDTRVGFLAGDGGRLFRIYRYWQSTIYEDISVASAFDLRGMHFTDAKYGWIVGKYGVVFRTVNGGHFSQVALLNIPYLNAVQFLDRNLGYTAGSNGKVFKSTNGGDNWFELPTNVNNTFTRVFFKDANNGWVLGAHGAILRTRTGGGVTSVDDPEQIQPSDFVLVNNFPNPFNPGTRISYSLPAAGHVSLRIYDILGREITELVSGVMEAGINSVAFNTAEFNLPSGTYIYSLRYQGKTFSGKMQLLK